MEDEWLVLTLWLQMEQWAQSHKDLTNSPNKEQLQEVISLYSQLSMQQRKLETIQESALLVQDKRVETLSKQLAGVQTEVEQQREQLNAAQVCSPSNATH